MTDLNDSRARPKVSLGLAVTLLVSGCNQDVSIREPTYARISDDSVRVQLQLGSDEAELIRDKEIYLTLTTLECESGGNRYPAEAFVGDEKVSGFDFPVAGEIVSFHADIPRKVFDRYERPCLVLEGGSYLSQEVASKPTPIEPGDR